MLDLFSEFNRIIERFQKEDIRYAVVGALAVAIHGGARATRDMDFLILSEEIDRTKKIFRELHYLEGQAWTFSNTGLTLIRFTRLASPETEKFFTADVLVADTGRFQDIVHNADEEPWAAGEIRVARIEDLIWMKSLRGSHIDLADIEILKSDRKAPDQ